MMQLHNEERLDDPRKGFSKTPGEEYLQYVVLMILTSTMIYYSESKPIRSCLNV